MPANRRGSGGLRMHQDALEAGALRGQHDTPQQRKARDTVPGGGEPAPGGAGRITRRLRTETAVEESGTRPSRPARPGGAARRRGGSTRERRSPPRCRPPPRPDCVLGSWPSTRAMNSSVTGPNQSGCWDPSDRAGGPGGAPRARPRGPPRCRPRCRCALRSRSRAPGCARLGGPREHDVGHRVGELQAHRRGVLDRERGGAASRAARSPRPAGRPPSAGRRRTRASRGRSARRRPRPPDRAASSPRPPRRPAGCAASARRPRVPPADRAGAAELVGHVDDGRVVPVVDGMEDASGRPRAR